MFKFVFLSLIVLFSVQSNAEYIRVIGIGNTLEEARLDGFRKAVTFRLGEIILTDLRISNNNIVREDLLNFSAGFVKDFKIINQQTDILPFSIEMDVLVESSKIFDRTLGRSDTGLEIDGYNIVNKLNQVKHNRQEASRLLNSLLVDYPAQAYNVEIKQTNFSEDNRRLRLDSVIHITLNEKFLDSLEEILSLIEENKSNSKYSVTISRRNKSLFRPVIEKTYFFNDEEIYSNLRNKLNRNRTKLKVISGSNGFVVESLCTDVHLGLLYTETNRSVKFDTQYIIRNDVRIFLNEYTFNNVTEISTKIVNAVNCNR